MHAYIGTYSHTCIQTGELMRNLQLLHLNYNIIYFIPVNFWVRGDIATACDTNFEKLGMTKPGRT